MRCVDCEWWVMHTRDGKPTGQGDCHRYPPRTVMDVTSGSDGDGGPQVVTSDAQDYWPTTAAEDFCGEFRKERV